MRAIKFLSFMLFSIFDILIHVQRSILWIYVLFFSLKVSPILYFDFIKFSVLFKILHYLLSINIRVFMYRHNTLDIYFLILNMFGLYIFILCCLRNPVFYFSWRRVFCHLFCMRVWWLLQYRSAYLLQLLVITVNKATFSLSNVITCTKFIIVWQKH